MCRWSRCSAVGSVRPAGWLYARQPQTLAQVTGGLSAAVGAYSVDARGYAEAIRIIESGRFPLERLHTHTFGLEDYGHAVEVLGNEVPGEDGVARYAEARGEVILAAGGDGTVSEVADALREERDKDAPLLSRP